MKLSILMASYNSEATIGESIESFINQSYQDKELIIIDGNSKDATIEIINSYDREDISYISEPDEGVYYALNKGLEIARGEWVYVMGSDDVLYSREVFENIFSNKFPKDISIIYGEVISNFYKNKKRISFDNPHKLFKKFNYAPPIFHQAVLFKNNELKNLNGFDTSFNIYADFDLLCRAVRADLRFMKIPNIITNYNASGLSGISTKNFFSNHNEFKKVLRTNNSLNILWRLRLLKNYLYFFYTLFRK